MIIKFKLLIIYNDKDTTKPKYSLITYSFIFSFMLTLLFTNLLFNIGLYLAVRDLPIFAPLMDYFKKDEVPQTKSDGAVIESNDKTGITNQYKILQTLCTPLFLCLQCMSSFWGVVFWLSNYSDGLDYTVFFVPFYVLSLYGMARIYLAVIDRL